MAGDLASFQPVRLNYQMDYESILKLITVPHYDDFIYRGEGRSGNPLIPYAYREKKDRQGLSGKERVKMLAMKYLKKQRLVPMEAIGDQEMVFYEIASLLWFYDQANRQGLRVPDIPQTSLGNELMEVQAQTFRVGGSDFLEKWSGIAAVAQHHGIPTRMLDWSFDINVALCFAVMSLPEEGPKEELPESVSLWVLDKSKASALSPDLRFVVPKYCDNPNIRAQSGLFTLLTGDDPGRDLRDVIEDIYENAELNRQPIVLFDGYPILLEIVIPYKDALELKRYFRNKGTGYDTLFPGWSGIARSMEIQSGIRKA